MERRVASLHVRGACGATTAELWGSSSAPRPRLLGDGRVITGTSALPQ